MKTVAFVPIKLNNERLGNKNTLSFDNGEPLLRYILKTLLTVENVDETYVFCSDESIKEYLPDGVIFLKRDKILDLSETKFNDVISAFVNMIPADVYVLTHATAPFMSSHSIALGVDKVVNEGYDSAFSVKKMLEFLWKDNKPLNYDLTDIPRTQDLSPIYVETCGLYVFLRDLVVTKNRRIGENAYLIEVTNIESIDINLKEDFEIANAIFNYVINNK